MTAPKNKNAQLFPSLGFACPMLDGTDRQVAKAWAKSLLFGEVLERYKQPKPATGVSSGREVSRVHKGRLKRRAARGNR